MITNKIIPFVPQSIDFANYADKNYWLKRYENVKSSFIIETKFLKFL